MGRKYVTSRGREIDLDKIMTQHELMPAIGNTRVNARGDELGPGGKIVRKREEIVAEYYEDNPNAIPQSISPVKTKTAGVTAAPAQKEVATQTESQTFQKKQTKVQDENQG
jgi:hypothetical protein